jgi:long-chain fatty acid transport protein
VIAGVAFDVSPQLKLLFDFNWINWRDSIALANGYPGNGILGSPSGPGPGWCSQKLVKAGVEYKVSPQWTVFAAVSGSNSLWSQKDNALNYYTLVTPRINTGFGLSFSPSKYQALSLGWNRAYGRTQRGVGLSSDVKLSSQFDTFAITYRYVF